MSGKAFTLIELSIVLVVIGLIVGGVLVGRDLIKAAELRTVITEFNKFQAAVNTFRGKYSGLPGDLINATEYWGAAHPTPSTCFATPGTGTQTCNGDGNEIIVGGFASQYGENFMFWQQLGNAGLIEGRYSGIAGSGGAGWATETNVAASKFSPAKWSVFNWNYTFTGSSGAFDGFYNKNSLQFGAINPLGGSPSTPVLTPSDSLNIDKKIDDGKPAYGLFRERFWDACTNATGSNDLGADYLLTEKSKTCLPYFYGGL